MGFLHVETLLDYCTNYSCLTKHEELFDMFHQLTSQCFWHYILVILAVSKYAELFILRNFEVFNVHAKH